MEGSNRRDILIKLLEEAKDPLSGNTLAKKLGVSRQVIVQDIALLRAVNKNILSTTKGYLLYYQEKQKANRCFRVKHTTEEIKTELCTIVDNGGRILDVIVEHPIYGMISVDLFISTRQDVYDFVQKVETHKTIPLKKLTNNVHFHTVEADNEQTLDRIEQALLEKNYLGIV